MAMSPSRMDVTALLDRGHCGAAEAAPSTAMCGPSRGYGGGMSPRAPPSFVSPPNFSNRPRSVAAPLPLISSLEEEGVTAVRSKAPRVSLGFHQIWKEERGL